MELKLRREKHQLRFESPSRFQGLFLPADCQSVSPYQSFQTRRTVIDQSVNQVIGAPAALLRVSALWLFRYGFLVRKITLQREHCRRNTLYFALCDL